jgi:hypothetical protein
MLSVVYRTEGGRICGGSFEGQSMPYVDRTLSDNRSGSSTELWQSCFPAVGEEIDLIFGRDRKEGEKVMVVAGGASDRLAPATARSWTEEVGDIVPLRHLELQKGSDVLSVVHCRNNPLVAVYFPWLRR